MNLNDDTHNLSQTEDTHEEFNSIHSELLELTDESSIADPDDSETDDTTSVLYSSESESEADEGVRYSLALETKQAEVYLKRKLRSIRTAIQSLEHALSDGSTGFFYFKPKNSTARIIVTQDIPHEKALSITSCVVESLK